MPSLPASLSLLGKHAIFLPPAPSPQEDEWELVDNPTGSTSASRLAMREKDLLVAWDSDVRMASLASAWDVHGGVVGHYRTLKTPHLSFDVRQLVVNPTGRLLAVVGAHQVVVVVIPPSSTSSGNTSVKSFAIDEFQFSPSAQVGIAKVLWHPLGEGGTSLWVLTDEGKLFEYDVLRPNDPAQTFHFLPSKPKASTSRFSAADPLSFTAVSFAFSLAPAAATSPDFDQFTVRVLAADGDVYAMSPILPLHATVPLRSLLALKAGCEARLRQLRGADDGAERAAEEGRVTMQAAWIDKLLSQVKQGAPAAAAMSPSPLASSFSESSLSTTPTSSVSLHPPHLTGAGGPAPGVHRPLLRQGPYLIDPPAPDAEENDRATGLALVATATGSKLVLTAWSSGRVDVALELDPPEPRWISSVDPAPPECVLATLESLALPAKAGDDAPRFLQDPVSDSTVYLQSAVAIDAIALADTAKSVEEAEGDIEPAKVDRKVASAITSDNRIIGAVPFCNIALGYGLLALSSAGQLATVEMDYRVGTPLPASTSVVPPPPEVKTKAVLTEPFDATPLLAAARSSTDALAAVRRHPTARQPLQTVNAEQVRLLVAASEGVRDRVDAVRAASQALEEHVDVLALEVQRHLALLTECSARIDEMRARATLDRVERVVRAQAKLGERLDRVLAELMNEYRPQIGEVERKWFDELDRLKARVGTGKAGLAQRAQVLKEQLAIVKPRVERAAADADDTPGSPNYGQKQLRPLQAALSARSDELARMLRKMESLSMKVEHAEGGDDE